MHTMILFCSLLFSGVLSASDFAKEQRWAEQTVDSIMDGEVVWLSAGEHKFLSIFTESEAVSNKGMIVLHGSGVHPNWGQVVLPVRVEMAALGWNTLSIQLPVLHNEASYEEYLPLYAEVAPRMQAAEAYLLAQGVEQIVVVAHSLGAAMSSYYLANNKHPASAFVAVGVQATQADSDINVATSLKSINIPVLDLYGSEDLAGVLDTRELRKQASHHNPAYRQQQIKGAGHFFDDKNDELIEAIDDWLKKLAN